MAQLLGVAFLGEIEIDPRIRIAGDSGKPVAALGEDATGAKSLYAMARQAAARLSVVNILAQSPLVRIL
jgi:ATP-binding protein involved in chromosome partitioning